MEFFSEEIIGAIMIGAMLFAIFIGFPISYYLGLYTSFESTGIWIGLFVGLFSASILLYLRFNYLTKKLITNNN